MSPGEYLFASGEIINSFVLVRKGQLTILNQKNEESIRIASLAPGALFGWRALMKSDQVIKGGIRAESNADVYLIPRHALLELETKNPAALLHFQRELISNAVARIQTLTSELRLL